MHSLSATISTPACAPKLVRRVLLVDDDVSVRTVLRRYLELRGWKVLEAGNADEALSALALRNTPVDVVVVDLHLPGLPGGALCRQIVDRYPALASRIVMASGDALAAVSALAREALHYPVLAKPFDLHDFVRVLDGVTATA